MSNIGSITETSLLLATILSFGSFFLFDNNIPVQALHKEEQILEDYDDLAGFAKAVRNGDEDLEEIPIESMESAEIYEDADDNMQDCIDLAARIGDSLTDREIVHCVDDVNYFKNKYLTNSSVPINRTLDTSTTVTDTVTDTETNTTSISDTISTSETPIFDNFQNNLIDELMKTGKFTEDEAKEFVSNNILSKTDSTKTSANTQTTSDTDAITDEISSSDNESTDDNLSGSNINNLEEYDNLSKLVNDIKNGDIDSDENSLNDFQNSGAYQGADQETQDCIDLAGKIGGNLIDYEIVRCSEDPNHFKNQIANNNNSNENNDI